MTITELAQRELKELKELKDELHHQPDFEFAHVYDKNGQSWTYNEIEERQLALRGFSK